MNYKKSIVFAFFAGEGLPAMVSEHRFHPDRKWRFDFAFLEQRVALEVEGGIFTYGRHSRGSGMQADMEKYNASTLLGWRVLRVQPKDLCTMETVKMLRKVLNAI